MASVSLKKGDSVNLHKEAPGLTKVIAGAGWDGKADAPIDLDLMAILIGSDGKPLPDENANGSNADEALLFFNNKELPGLHHTGDNRTGEGEGDDEQIEITLGDVATTVSEISVVVVIYDGPDDFSKVANAFCRMVNAADNAEIAKYEISTGYDGKKGVELGRLVRNGTEWDFKATGVALEGSDFDQMVANLGITA